MSFCSEITLKGLKCKRIVSKGEKCFQHIQKAKELKVPKEFTNEKIIVPDVYKLSKFDGILDGMKIIPYLMRVSKLYPNKICNLKTGVGKLKIFNSVIFLKFSGNIYIDEPERMTPYNIVEKIKECKSLVIISLALINVLGNEGHSNLLIFNPQTKEVERYEPLGKISFNKIIDDQVISFLKNFPTYKYIKPQDFCPEINHGNCSSLSALYGTLRILNPNVDRSLIANYMVKNINIYYLKRFITYVNSIVTDSEIKIWTTTKESYA